MDYEENFKKFLNDGSCERKSRADESVQQKFAVNKVQQSDKQQESPGSDDQYSDEIIKGDLHKATKFSKATTSVTEDIVEIAFQDLLPCSDKHLKIIYHDPIYELPIPTNPKYQHYSLEKQLKMLESYHTKLSEIQTKLAKRSIYRAPPSKLIFPSKKCINSLLKNAEDEHDTIEEYLDSIPTVDFYVSRAGRQVKRKIYTEDEGDSDFDLFATANKKTKSFSPNTKITLDTPYVDKEIVKEIPSNEKNTPKFENKGRNTPKRLFSLGTRKSSRCETMFDNLVHETEKKRQQQQEMEYFEQTLSGIDEVDEESSVVESPIKESRATNIEQKFVRQRIIPPIPTQKGGKPRKQVLRDDFDQIDLIPSSPLSSPVLSSNSNATKRVTRKNVRARKLTDEIAAEQEQLVKVDCPICGQKFLQTDIETHASNCGENSVEEIQDNKCTTITCNLCDKVFFQNTQYEVHVKQCIAAQVTDM